MLLSNERQGYIYLSEITVEHPLYGELQRLDKRLYQLGGGVVPPQNLQTAGLAGEVVIGGVSPQAYPEDQLSSLQQTWEASTRLESEANLEALAPDLQARLAWERMQMRSQASEQVRQAEADESQRLAEIRMKAIRERQERLNNIGLNLKTPESEALALAEAERRRLWAEIDEITAREQRDGAQRLAELRTRVQASERKQIVDAERSMLRRMAQRIETPISSTAPLRQQISNALAGTGKPQWVTAGPGVKVSSEAAGQMLGSAQRDWDATMSTIEATRREQIALMLGRRAALAKLILQGTRSAALRTAAELGYTITFPPTEPSQGENLTPALQQALHRLWHGDVVAASAQERMQTR